jgi:HK97 family phage portal protein
MNLWQSVRAGVANIVSRLRPIFERVFVSTRQAGVAVTEDTALTYSAVWACVSVISRTIAAMPWHVFERSAQGRKTVEGMVSWLLNNQPNAEMTAFSFREALMLHVLTWGNGYAEIQRDLAGRPVALWLLLPDRVTPARDVETGALIYRVWDDAGGIVELAADQVLHIHGMGFDGLVGYSPIRMAARTIGMAIAQDVFGQSFYANGTVFGAVLEMPGGMNPAQIAESEKYYNDHHKGPDKAFSIRVAPAGVKVHNLSMPMTDAQFLESRKFSVTEIARWYGVPPHKIAELDRSTNNNIEHQGIEFVSDAIVPWAVRLEQEVNVKLFGIRAQGRVYTKLAVNALMRGDSKSRAEFYRLMTQMGAMSINEVRAMEDLNGIGAAGDQHLVQLNQTTLEWLVENPEGAKASVTESTAPAQESASTTEASGDTPSQADRAGNVIRAGALEWYRAARRQA